MSLLVCSYSYDRPTCDHRHQSALDHSNTMTALLEKTSKEVRDHKPKTVNNRKACSGMDPVRLLVPQMLHEGHAERQSQELSLNVVDVWPKLAELTF